MTGAIQRGGKLPFHTMLILWLLIFAALLSFSCEETTGPEEETPTTAQKLLIYSSAPAISANGGSTQILVKVYAENDTTNVVSGVKVSFSAVLSGSRLVIPAQNDITDAKGYARATLYAGTRSGTAAVTATIENFSNSLFVTVSPGSGLVYAAPSSILADGTSRSVVTATVIDSLGQPLAGAQVNFSSSGGTITPQSFSNQNGQATAVLTSAPSATDISAVVTANVSAGKLAKVAVAEADSIEHPGLGVAKPAASIGTTTVVFRGITIAAEAEKNTVFANAEDSTLVTFTVTETTAGSAVIGKKLKLSTTVGTLRKTELLTDVSGMADVFFFGGSVSGNPVITATLGSGLTFTTQLSLVKQLFMTLESDPSVLSANGTDVATIKASLYDADNNPIAGETVYFKTSHGKIENSALTDDWGEASVQLRSARYNETAQITASYETISRSTYITFTGADIKLSAVPLIIVADGEAETNVSATLTDASGSPIVDEVVTIQTSLGTLTTRDGLSTGTAIIDSTTAEGIVTALLKSTTAGTAQVLVTTQGLRDSLDIEFTDYTFSVTSADEEILAGGEETTLTATLRDKDGTIIAIDASDVEFSPTIGAVTSITQNDDGTVSAVLKSGQNAGPSTVTASVKDPGVSASTSVMFIAADVGRIDLAISKSFVRIGKNSVEVVATVFDETGNPKANETVTFSIAKGPGGGEKLDGDGTAVTNDVGQAIVRFISGMMGSEQNGVEIQARVGTIIDKATLTITGQPETVVVGFDTENFSKNSDGTYGLSVSAIVSDVNRNKVVDGTVVNFSLDGDVGIIDSEVPTSNGVASTVLIYSPSDAGKSVNVTAQSGGKKDTKEVTLPGATGTVATISAQPTETAVVADGVSTTNFTITVAGPEGEPINNLTINCEAEIGTMKATTLTGDPSNPESTPGVAYARYTGPALQEDREETVTFTAGGVIKTVNLDLKGITIEATAEPDMLPSDGQSKSEISVLVKETTTHIPLVGQQVRFGATEGTIGATATTDNSGVATTSFTAGYNAGVTDVYVTYGNALVDTVTVTISEVTARGIELFANPTQIAANGISQSTITALLRDDNFNPVVGELIRFTTSLGTITAADSTDEYGRAEVILESERRNGEALVTATFKEHVKSIPVNFTGVKLDVTATPENLFAGGNETTQVTAYLKDAAEVPIVGEEVEFDWSLDGNDMGKINAVTDVQGRATIDLSSDTSGLATILVKGAGADASAAVTFTRVQFTIGSDSDTVPSGGDNTNLWVQIYDTVNEKYIQGATVNFYTTNGSISTSSVTDANGRATATLTSSSTAGVATVSASTMIDGTRVSTEKEFTFTNAEPASVSLRVDANIVGIGGNSSALIAVVTDKFGNPVSDVLVSFQIAEGPAGGEVIKPPTVTTGISGTATTYFYSGQIPSDYEGVKLVAHVGAITSNTAALTIAGSPETVKPSFNADWSLDDINNNDGTYTLPISATVLDVNSNGVVDGTTVYFKIEPAEGAVLSPVKTENSVAVSSITYPSASAGREVRLTASAGGKEGTISFSLPGFMVSYMTLQASPKTILADGKSTSELKATLFDRNGSSINVPDGTTVSFTTDGGILDPAVVKTVDGVAMTTLTSDRTPGKFVLVEAQSGIWSADTYVYFEEIGSSVNQVGDIVLKAYDENNNENPTIEADGISSARIVAELTKYNGDPVTTPTTVAFESNIGQITNFVRSDSEGLAVASFSSGEVGTATITATVGSIVGYASVVVTPGEPQSIELSVNPISVNVKGAGKNESLVITGTVKDSKGNPVADGNMVKFRMVGSYDQESSLTPEGDDQWESSPVPTLNGKATVSFLSGTHAGAVRVDATVVDEDGDPVSPLVTSETTQFMVYGGPAYLDMSKVSDPFTESRIKLYTGPANIYAGEIGTDYNKSTITATVADKYNNPVPPGTAVYFTTTGGYITNATGYTDENGMASVTLFSGNPFPTLTNSGSIGNPNYGSGYPGSPSSFTMPRYDFDGNGQNNDGIAVVSARTEGLDDEGDNVTVWNYAQVIFSLHVDTFSISSNRYTLNLGEVATISIRIQDMNGNPIVKDSNLTISTTEGSLSTSSITTGDPGRNIYTTTLTNNLDPLVDSPTNATVTVKLESKNGNYTVQIDNPIYLTISNP